MLIEPGQAIFEFLHQPSREALGLSDCELAEFRAAAGDGPSPEWRTFNRQTDRAQFFRQRRGIGTRHVHDQQVLHIRRTELAVGKTVGEIGRGTHLLGINTPPKDGRTNGEIARLLLRIYTDVIAIDVQRRLFLYSWIKDEADALLKFLQKTVSGPAVAQEEEFQACTFPVLTQVIRTAKDLRDPLDGGQYLIPLHKGIQTPSKEWLG